MLAIVNAGSAGKCKPVIDADGDGIPDAEDACPESDLAPTVIIDGTDTGVANELFADGCTISDQIAECAESALNHGDFVMCVRELVTDLGLTGREFGAIMSAAAAANIP